MPVMARLWHQQGCRSVSETVFRTYMQYTDRCHSGAVREAQVEQWFDLVSQKQAIEDQIDGCLKRVERGYVEVSGQFSAALQGRKEELKSRPG
jgi:hypothetical protein